MKLKKYYMQFNNETSCCIEECESPSGYWVKYHDAKDTIESQQQEIAQEDKALEQARETIKSFYTTKFSIEESERMSREALTAIDKALGGNGDGSK